MSRYARRRHVVVTLGTPRKAGDAQAVAVRISALRPSDTSHQRQEDVASTAVMCGRCRSWPRCYTTMGPRHPRVVGVETDDRRDTTMADDRMALLETRAQGDRRGRRRLPARGRPGARPGGHGGRGERAHRASPRASATRSAGSPTATATATGAGTPGSARSSSPSRGSATAPTCRRCSSPRRRTERALLAVVQEAYVPGVSTRRVDDLVRALGIDGHQQERGQPDLRRARRRGRGLPEPAARRRGVSLPVARRDVPQGPRGRPGRVDGGARRHRRRARPASAGCWASSSRRATTRARPGRVHPLARRARPARRPAGHQRRPPGAREGGPRAAPGLRLAALIGAQWRRDRWSPSRTERRAPWQRRSAEVLRQTRASAREASLHRPEGDVPRAPDDERPGWAAPLRDECVAWRAASWRSSSGSTGASSITRSMRSTGDGATRLSLRVAHDRAGLERLRVALAALGEPCEVGVAIERREGLLVDHLLGVGPSRLPGQPEGRGPGPEGTAPLR